MSVSQASNKRYIISVLVPDRVGLLCDITGAVYALGANIGEIRQTVVDGFFNLVFTGDFPPKVSSSTVQASIALKLTDIDEPVISVTDFPELPPTPPVESGSRFIAMTAGVDRPGTIFAITSFLVGHGVNIEDWTVSTEGNHVIYIAQVAVPVTVDSRLVQSSFKEEMAKIGLTAVLCHENIFRATNEIGPIKALLDQQK